MLQVIKVTININIEKVFEMLTEEEQVQFLENCYLKTISNTFKGDDDSTFFIKIQNTNRIMVTGKNLKNYTSLYIEKYANEHQVKQYLEYVDLLEQCYKAYLETKGKPLVREEKLLKQGINLNAYKISALAYKYCYIVKNLSVCESKELLQRTSKYRKTIDELIKIDKPEDVISFLKENDKTPFFISALKLRVFDYIILNTEGLTKKEKDDLEKKILDKINLYATHVNKAKQKNKEQQEQKHILELLPNAQTTILDFVHSNMTIKEYCQTHTVSEQDFKLYVSLIKTYDSTTHSLYISQVEINQKRFFFQMTNNIKYILPYIKHGIKISNTTTRPFDILDYYLLMNLPIKDTERYINYMKEKAMIENNDYRDLKRFFSQNKNQSNLDIKQIMNAKIEVDAQKDKNGYPIAGSGRVINNSEKQKIIDYLKNNNIPLTTKLYNLALRRYTEGTLSLENSDTSIKNPVKTKILLTQN